MRSILVYVFSKRFADEAAARAYVFDRLADVEPDSTPPSSAAWAPPSTRTSPR